MKRLNLRTLALIPMLFLLTACPNPPPAEESCNFVQNSFSRRVSWARTPILFYIDKASFEEYAALGTMGTDENGSPLKAQTLYQIVREAMEFWNNEFEEPVFKLVGVTEDPALKEPVLNAEGRVVPDRYNAIYFVEKEKFENTNSKDEQARTSISFRGDYIYEADVVIDASEVFYFVDETRSAAGGRVQFKSLMIHELGHVLGLGHVENPEVNSVMFPKLQFGQLRPLPTPLVDDNGDKVLSAQGTEVLGLQLPEIDRDSLACEYK